MGSRRKIKTILSLINYKSFEYVKAPFISDFFVNFFEKSYSTIDIEVNNYIYPVESFDVYYIFE